MTHQFARWWSEIWPNLAASVIWTVPAIAWQHRRTRRHISRLMNQRTTVRDNPPLSGGL